MTSSERVPTAAMAAAGHHEGRREGPRAQRVLHPEDPSRQAVGHHALYQQPLVHQQQTVAESEDGERYKRDREARRKPRRDQADPQQQKAEQVAALSCGQRAPLAPATDPPMNPSPRIAASIE